MRGPLPACVVLLLVTAGCGTRAAPQPGPAAPGSPPAPVAPPTPPPTVRREGNLVVEWPTTRRPTRGGRGRTHVDGPLDAASTRYWAGPTNVPDYVPLTRGRRELFLLDESSEGDFALYREPYGASPTGCALTGPRAAKNCEFEVAFFAPDRTERWAFRLDELLSRPDHLEVQDARYSGGLVYFNEACQSYSREAHGRCSSLVVLDPSAADPQQRIRWRSRPLVSNGELAVVFPLVLVSYGFTAERDSFSLVSVYDGNVVARLDLPVACEGIDVLSQTRTTADVVLTLADRDAPWRIHLESIDQVTPLLQPATPAPPPSPDTYPVLHRGMRDPVTPPR